MSFPTRKIGSTEVSPIGFGCTSLSGAYGPVQPDEERFKFLDAVHASGCRFWDTADKYGDSEDLLGKWFKLTGKRDDIFLATKFGFAHKNTDRPLGVNGTPEHVREAIDNSLKRLGVSCIDLWYLHRPDPSVPIEITIGAMVEVVKAGKAKYIGISGCSASTLRRAHAVHPIAAAQFEYAAFTLDVETRGIVETCKELGIALVAFSPLGRGLLTGTFTNRADLVDGDVRKAVSFPRFQEDVQPAVRKLVKCLSDVGVRHGASAAQVSLAWLLAQGDNVIPIPSTTKLARLEENMGAKKVYISEEEEKAIREAAESFASIPANTGSLAAMEFLDTPQLSEK